MSGVAFAAGPAGPVDPAAPRAAPAHLPTGAYILPADKVPEILRQCSRDTPATGEGNWAPDVATVLALERLLPGVLARQNRDRNWSAFPSGWGRQYVGIVRHGRRFLYGSFGPVASLPNRPARDVMTICDGGDSFFGAEYDVASGKISHLAFNGVT